MGEGGLKFQGGLVQYSGGRANLQPDLQVGNNLVCPTSGTNTTHNILHSHAPPQDPKNAPPHSSPTLKCENSTSEKKTETKHMGNFESMMGQMVSEKKMWKIVKSSKSRNDHLKRHTTSHIWHDERGRTPPPTKMRGRPPPMGFLEFPFNGGAGKGAIWGLGEQKCKRTWRMFSRTSSSSSLSTVAVALMCFTKRGTILSRHLPRRCPAVRLQKWKES